MRNLKFISIVCLFISASVFGQVQTIDGIISKVDDFIILRSDLENTYNAVRQQGQQGGKELRCQILQRLVLNKMLVAQAEIDSLVIEEGMVDERLNRKIQMVAAQYGGVEALEEYYGKSMDQIRMEIRAEEKESLIIERMTQNISGEMRITPAEVKRFFNKIPEDSIPFLSAQVEVGQIVIKPTISREMKNRVKANLIEIREKILGGEVTFEDMARRYSQDPGSAREGGDLGFASRGQMVPSFEAAAMKLKPGEISMPVESDFGIHMIKLIERRGNEYNAKHILIRPETSYKDIQRTKNYLDSLRGEIMKGNISFSKAAKEYSEDMYTSGNGGFFQGRTGANTVSIENLDPDLFFTIDTMTVGNISQPLEFKMPDGSKAVRIINYKSRIAPHQANYEDDYQTIRFWLEKDKEQRALIDWFDNAKSKIYVDIDEKYTDCRIMQ